MTRISATLTAIMLVILSIFVIGQAPLHAVIGQGFTAVTLGLLTVALAIVELDR